MGMFDTVHTGTRCGQTKALGKSLADYTPGDPVRLHPAPLDEAALEAWAAGQEPADPRGPVADFQLAMPEGGFVRVRDGVLLDWAEQADPTLPAFDNAGYRLEQHPSGESRYLDAAGRAELEATIAGEATAESAEERLWNRVLGRRPLAELDPDADAAEIAQRQAQRRDAAREELNQRAGLPGDCGYCAAVRSGTVPAFRARRRAEIAALRADADSYRDRASRPAGPEA